MTMSDTYDYEYDYDSYPQPQLVDEDEGRISPFAVILLAPFIIAAVSVAALPGANYIVVGIGVICAISYLMASIRGGFIFPKEVLLFWAFILWSMLGMFNVKVPFLFFSRLFTVFKFSVMIVIIAHYAKNVRTVNILLSSVLVAALIIAVSAYMSGEYTRAEVFEERAAGIVINANVFALTLIFATTVLLYFFRTWRSWIMKGAVVVLILVIARFIIASGSRKGFICFLLLLFSWFIFSYTREILHHPATAIVGLITVLGVSAFFYLYTAGTVMGRRMKETEAAMTGDLVRGGVASRSFLLKEGLYLIKSYPIVGVGHGNFIVYTPQLAYSHNNYVEVFVSTGIPGGVIYYSIFVILWLRLRRLSKLPLGNKARELVNIAKTYLVVRFIADMATVSYYSKLNWILLAVFIGWTYHEERRLRESAFADTDEYNLEPQEPEGQYQIYG